MRAIYNGEVIAESEETVRVEGHHYFPPDAVRREHLRPSRMRSLCFWKGAARYCDVEAGGSRSPNAAWYYPRPFPWIRKIRDHVAFWGDVRVVE